MPVPDSSQVRVFFLKPISFGSSFTEFMNLDNSEAVWPSS